MESILCSFVEGIMCRVVNIDIENDSLIVMLVDVFEDWHFCQLSGLLYYLVVFILCCRHEALMLGRIKWCGALSGWKVTLQV